MTEQEARKERLHTYKRERGYTVTAMAKLFGISTATMCRYLSGKLPVTDRTIIILEILEEK